MNDMTGISDKPEPGDLWKDRKTGKLFTVRTVEKNEGRFGKVWVLIAGGKPTDPDHYDYGTFCENFTLEQRVTGRK